MRRAVIRAMTNIELATAYTDGSGLEALITVDGVAFACNWTTERSVRCVSTGSMLRSNRKRLVAIATRAFTALCDSMGSTWTDRRAAMYA